MWHGRNGRRSAYPEAVLEPQGPLPREIYVRRRLAALILVAVVVVAVVVALVLVSRDGGSGADPSAAAGSETSETSASENSSETSTEATEEDEADDPASRGRCADDGLDVEVRPASANFEAGSDARFYAEITNTSASTCDRDLSGAPLTFEVYRLDDNARVWSSTDCTQSDSEDVANLEPDEPVMRQIDWSGRMSEPGACGQRDRAPAEPGSYQVYALVGDAFSPAATFNLTAPAE